MGGLAIGFFDGVHLGHQAILTGAEAALTFRNHPLTVLAPAHAPRLVMTPEERVAAIKACGVREVTVLEFTRELAEMTAEEFAFRYLASGGSLRASSVRCGGNWHFGAGGAGDAEFLRRRGIAVEVVPYAEYRGERISSSRIRACLEGGAIEDANAMTGRRFLVSGVRQAGKGLGGRIGYPTVNVEILKCETVEAARIRLKFGVYEVEVGGVRGIANYGLAPTMGVQSWRKPVLEVHFLGAGAEEAGRGAGSLVTVSLVRFIRSERKFASVADLRRQIAADCASCLAVRQPTVQF